MLKATLDSWRVSQLTDAFKLFADPVACMPLGHRPDGLWRIQGLQWQDYVMALVDAPTFGLTIPDPIRNRPGYNNYLTAITALKLPLTATTTTGGPSSMHYYKYVVIAPPVRNTATNELLQPGVFSEEIAVLAADDATALMLATAKLAPVISKFGEDRCKVKMVSKTA